MIDQKLNYRETDACRKAGRAVWTTGEQKLELHYKGTVRKIALRRYTFSKLLLIHINNIEN